MKWYITQLIYQIYKPSVKPQYDEQIRLISADDLESARLKLQDLGASYEEEFEDVNGNTVLWKLVETSVFGELKMIKDGMVLFSSTHENDLPLKKHGLHLEKLQLETLLIE